LFSYVSVVAPRRLAYDTLLAIRNFSESPGETHDSKISLAAARNRAENTGFLIWLSTIL
jgi:hypothetical protein